MVRVHSFTSRETGHKREESDSQSNGNSQNHAMGQDYRYASDHGDLISVVPSTKTWMDRFPIIFAAASNCITPMLYYPHSICLYDLPCGSIITDIKASGLEGPNTDGQESLGVVSDDLGDTEAGMTGKIETAATENLNPIANLDFFHTASENTEFPTSSSAEFISSPKRSTTVVRLGLADDGDMQDIAEQDNDDSGSLQPNDPEPIREFSQGDMTRKAANTVTTRRSNKLQAKSDEPCGDDTPPDPVCRKRGRPPKSTASTTPTTRDQLCGSRIRQGADGPTRQQRPPRAAADSAKLFMSQSNVSDVYIHKLASGIAYSLPNIVKAVKSPIRWDKFTQGEARRKASKPQEKAEVTN